MSSTLVIDPEGRTRTSTAPHLSHSRVNRYLLCPEQYRLYYVENLRLKRPSASLVFGQIIHQSLAQFFSKRDEPVGFFLEAWRGMQQIELTYGVRESWDKLKSIGARLIEKFVQEDAARITEVAAVERPFSLSISDLELPFVGVIDLLAEVDREVTVVDFKTAAAAYEPHEVALSDQLTAYQLAEPTAARVALCVLVKAIRTPRIEWHFDTRSPAQLTEYLAKLGLVGSEISLGHFYKRPGKWCAWCDYLPVCLGDTAAVKETLVQIQVQ